MSAAIHPPPHAPFRDPTADLFAPSGAATSLAEFPPILDSAPIPFRAPFPIFQHRHTSPYPMSFSALGAPGEAGQPLHAAQPPPAPRTSPSALPRLGQSSSYPAQPSTPEARQSVEPERRRHRPEAMVKLAPPADDGQGVADQPRDERGSETPRRSPVVSIDLNSMETTPSTTVSRSNSEGRRKKRTDADLAKRRSMGPPPRPVRANTSYPASTPASVRMEPSRSQESRTRVRNGMPGRSQTFSPYAVPFPTGAGASRSSADLTTLPPRESSTGSGESEAGDLGGPEGLEAKVVLLGSQGVGKTSLILRFTTRTFTPNAAPATIGSSLHTRKLVHGGIRVKLQIWDTAGQERFRSMAPIYYRGAHVCVLVYDISDRQSFEDVRSWLEELGRTVPKETMIYVVGAKIDLERKRAVSLEEARSSIRTWLRPPAPPAATLLSPPPQRGLFRSPSASNKLDVASSSTPARSYSHGALAAYDVPLPPSAAPSAAPTPARTASSGILMAAREPSRSGPGPTPEISPVLKARPPPALRITPSSSSKPSRRVAFPTLQSPTQSVTGTTTEHVNSSFTPSSPTRHGTSGGRFSISGVLGLSRSESMSGAALNLARLVEDYPVDPNRASQASRLSPSPARVRTESTPLLGAPSQMSGRRKSEDWSSRSWRMGGGPGAAEALGEFGASIKKKESEELLSNAGGLGRRGSHGSGMSLSPVLASGSQMGEASSSKDGQPKIVRSRGGSLGRDSRLYPSSEDEDKEWGVEVGGVLLGECSSLSGAGVEALFKSISSLLVQKKDKIERDRQLRRKNSVMLVDPAKDVLALSGGKGRFGCCA